MGQVIGSAIAAVTVRPNAGVMQFVDAVEFSGPTFSYSTLAGGNQVFLLIVYYTAGATAVTSITSTQGVVGEIGPLTPRVVDTVQGVAIEIWSGSVDTPGQEHFSINGIDAFSMGILAVEMTANYGPETNWFVDNALSSDVTTATTTPALQAVGTPTDFPSLFIGLLAGDTPVTAGATSNFVYQLFNDDLVGNDYALCIFQPNIVTNTAPSAHFGISSRYVRSSALIFAAQGDTQYDTSCDIRFPVVPTGVMWIVYQLSLEVISTAAVVNVTAEAFLNHRSTYTLDVPGAIQGPPYYVIRPGDDLVVTVTGASVGAQCVATLLYQETSNGPTPGTSGVV